MNLSTERIVRALATTSEIKEDLRGILCELNEGGSIEAFSERVWNIYSKVEHIVLIIKLEVGRERPGILINKKEFEGDPKEKLTSALHLIDEAIGALKDRQLDEALEKTRNARDKLKGVLIFLRKKS